MNDAWNIFVADVIGQAAGVYHQVKSEIDIHVNYGSGCPNIVRCYGYFYDEKRCVLMYKV